MEFSVTRCVFVFYFLVEAYFKQVYTLLKDIKYEQRMCLQPVRGLDGSKGERGSMLGRRQSWTRGNSKAKPELHHLIAMRSEEH